MKHRLILAIVLIAAAVSHAAAAYKAESYYDDARYGLQMGFGTGWFTSPDFPQDKYLTGNPHGARLAVDTNLFWFPTRHWGVAINCSMIDGRDKPERPAPDNFGFADGFVRHKGRMSEFTGGIILASVAPVYRIVVKRVVFSAELNLGITELGVDKHREFMAKPEGGNDMRSLFVDLHGCSKFMLRPRLTCCLPLGRNFAFIATTSLTVSPGSWKYDTTLADSYSGQVISRGSGTIKISPAIDVTLGISFYFNGRKKHAPRNGDK